MKQNPSEKQWQELSKEHETTLIKFLDDYAYEHQMGWSHACNIGNMIAFLDEDIAFIEWNYSPHQPKIRLISGTTVKDNNLCDALWEAVKFKLNNNET